MPVLRRVVVVGGGISGLATAHALARDAADVEVVLLEADDRLGGKVLTPQIAGHPVDAGPDSLLVRLPAMQTLLAELGLTDAVVAPGATAALVWSRGRLRPLPPGSMLGVPQRPVDLLTSGLLSPRGFARAGLDLVLPRRRRPVDSDPSIGQVLRPRLGDELFDRLVDPLLGGVHAGRADLLSARSAVPEVAAMLRDGRSLYLSARSRRPSASAGPALVTLAGGLTTLVDAMAATLHGVDVRLGVGARGLQRDGERFRVLVDGGPDVVADAVVLATPAYVAARLLADLAPDAAAAAGEVPYADVASLTLAYPRAAVTRPLDATGFLVPPQEGLLLVGCSWLPTKWPQLDDPTTVLLRGMVGRHGDRRFLDMSDDELVTRVHGELALTMGLAAPPQDAQVQRWPRAMPQYTVGHQDRLDRVDRALRRLPGLHVTGAGYRGVGVASCVAQGERTAADVRASLARDGVPAGASA